MRMTFHPSFRWAAAGLLLAACSAQSESGKPISDAAGGADVGGTASGGAVGSGGSGAPATGGASGGGGISGGSGGATADAPIAADGGSADGSSGGEGGPTSAAACADATYPVCMDFEKVPDAKWTGIGANVQTGTGKAAHGNAAFHGPPTSKLTTTQLGTITNVMWGRFYLHMTPKAPVGHGEMVGVFDQAGNWYEIGFEFNALQGNWHGNGGEKYMRTKMLLPDRYVCVEFLLDGETPKPAQIWMDGEPVVYSDVSPLQGPSKATKFTKLEIGFNPYHGLSTVNYEGNVMPMTDMWIDDIAADTKRIGCISN
ncbi:MAG TPA: hypothetical protein VNO55_17810 [Polyangia bacterium]|nr:hypothetical protein [Polyangia bacterium]